MRVYVETYGCALNRSDEALMKHVLIERGHTIVDNPSNADVVIINTCTVRLDTEQHILNRISSLRELAQARKSKLIVAGCLPAAQPYKVAKTAPEASLVSPQNSSRIYVAVESDGKVVMLDGVRERDRIGLFFENKIAPIPIQEGCLSNCSFCITKHARRVLVSHTVEAIVKSVETAVRMGAVEIQLTGMDLGTYGMELYGKRYLPELVRRVSTLPGEFRVRIGMINPEHLPPILDELLEAVKSDRRIYRFLHIPLQSGSDKVLKAMNRKYTVDEYRGLIKEVKRKISDVSIATDIIVGHPLEDEEDFEETLKIIRELEFERVHFAGYSVRPNTLSAGMPNIPTRIRKERMLRMLETVEEVGLKVREKYIGLTLPVFITEYSNTWVGRLDNYIPVILVEGGPLKYGITVETVIEKATFYDLRGRVRSN
jgi:MiaB-like tRNA modifying enzyme